MKNVSLVKDINIKFFFLEVNESGERTFSFARKPGADTKIQKEELDVDILDQTNIFHIGSLSLTDQPARDTTFYAVKRAKNKGSIISGSVYLLPAFLQRTREVLFHMIPITGHHYGKMKRLQKSI